MSVTCYFDVTACTLALHRCFDVVDRMAGFTTYFAFITLAATRKPASERGHFHLIHHATGFKADIYLAGHDPLHTWGLARRRRIELSGEIIPVAPPEYVIVRKLEYFREGGSEKHLRDIRGMLELSREQIDWLALQDWIQQRNLQPEWQRVAP